ncbi:DUF86 domain-containing protein [Paenibacillus gansuensis]|uniref:DUF86 domain-containing protein n=1 Tax=Paenibacillus gansuensis TaxID=306542 RepID=A0ABW5PG40_9BACL
MYYVNREQIERRLDFLPAVAEAMEELNRREGPFTVLEHFAQERTLHLAIEAVTDVGSYMIDGFIMRDPSSYEDILDILQGEGVFPAEVHAVLYELVKLRKPLVQSFFEWERVERHPLLPVVPGVLRAFSEAVRSYMDRELA